MRAGKKVTADTGKTRSCFVYVKNLKESEPIAPAAFGKQKIVLRKATVAAKSSNSPQTDKIRETRTSRRVASTTQIERRQSSTLAASTPIATRSRQLKVEAATPTPTPTPTPTATPTQLRKRRNSSTTPIVDTSAAKLKMFKQSKIAAPLSPAAPPPTIAASRSRRSIKPNPKYASEDLVTPKYVGTLGSESPTKRLVKHLFADDDDDLDADLAELIEEDNDDEVRDAAFNPQLHKSDDDDEISDSEFEQRRKLPAKRGRGRPPKSAAAATATHTQAQTPSARNAGLMPLQQLRRNIQTAGSITRPHITAPVVVGTKRKLEEHKDSPVARKRLAGEPLTSRAPLINGSSTTKTLTLQQAKGKTTLASTAGNSNLRLAQANAAKRPIVAATGARSTIVVQRSGTAVRSAANATVTAAAAIEKSTGRDDVPTFTIVNIDEIINQDDVLITRTAAAGNNNNRKQQLSPATRTNNNNSSSSNNSLNNSNTSTSSLSPNNKRIKPMVATATTATNSTNTITLRGKPLLAAGAVKATPAVLAAKPRPRILNSEMGKKSQPLVKPMISMGAAEEELHADEEVTVAPRAVRRQPASAASTAAGTQTVTSTAAAGGKFLATRRNVLATTAAPANANNNNNKQRQQPAAGTDRKLTKLLAEGTDDDVFKKPASPCTNTSNAATPATAATAAALLTNHIVKTNHNDITDLVKPPKYFPPETTTYCEEEGRIIKKVTCYETWHVIGTPKDVVYKTRQQRTSLELPLIKLANLASRIKVPSSKWTSKVTLYKVSPNLLQRQSMTIYTGDLKSYNIAEDERHKYQPSCVLFRRSVLDRNKCRVPFDRAIIFKNKCFYANIDGKHVNLLGAPEVVNNAKEVEILIDIIDSLALTSDLVEMVTAK
ncbi:flocculation protein FLO11 [Drosophila busckii]|uniref:flocculation protein FLO11 n=1 Tax=Drosophila busckii TaxID=30019 RepID=UPI00083EB6E7|nr:flocculation protein FLO11 [Drosophila busckii]XP_017853188.1 flocculation protein FLO11 [Drosophila busckii]